MITDDSEGSNVSVGDDACGWLLNLLVGWGRNSHY